MVAPQVGPVGHVGIQRACDRDSRPAIAQEQGGVDYLTSLRVHCVLTITHSFAGR